VSLPEKALETSVDDRARLKRGQTFFFHQFPQYRTHPALVEEQDLRCFEGCQVFKQLAQNFAQAIRPNGTITPILFPR